MRNAFCFNGFRCFSMGTEQNNKEQLLFDFLLLACYVPNVAKRSVWEQCNIEDRRPTDRPRILENFERPDVGNGSSDPLHVGF